MKKVAARAVLLAFAISLMRGQVRALGDEAESRKTLRGIPAISVNVEVKDDLKTAGLSEESLKTDTELRLRNVGIRVVSEDGLQALPGRPYLQVTVSGGPQVTTEGRKYAYVASIRISVVQEVRLVGEAAVSAQAETWYVYSSFYGTNINKIREYVRDHADEFANAYLAVNPKR